MGRHHRKLPASDAFFGILIDSSVGSAGTGVPSRFESTFVRHSEMRPFIFWQTYPRRPLNLVWILVPVGLLFLQTGCMPQTGEERVAKHRSSKEVAGRWTSVRGSRGPSSTSNYTVNDKTFDALWEITNPIGGHIKLQMKLPPDWTPADVYTAAEHVFLTEEKQPWYYPIEETFLSDLNSGLQSAEESSVIPGGCEDMPYECSTTVIKRENEYFVEMTASLIPGVE